MSSETWSSERPQSGLHRSRGQAGEPARRRFIRLALAAALVLLSAGCVGAVTGEPTDPDPAPTNATLWERGLASHLDTPAVAITRSDAERRADVAPPGDPAFVVFDAAIEGWMARYDIPSGQLALMHEGKLRYESGYGHTDEAGAKATDNLTMYRVASVTKPLTGAVVSLQVEEGLYEWDDPVFCIEPIPAPDCIIRIQPHSSHTLRDERLRGITVAQLLDHTAGWGRPADPNLWGQGHVQVAEKLGLAPPLPPWRVAQYMLGEVLSYDPGADYEYCNVCYLMLGLVAESASGASLPALYEAYLFRPLEVTGHVEPGHTLKELRNPREPIYSCDSEMDSVYEPGTRGCAGDVGVDLGTILAAGGMIATTAAVAAIYEVHESVFSTDVGPIHQNGHTGSLPGTATFVGTVNTPVGEVQYAVFFNSRAPNDIPVESVYDLEQAILASATAWGAAESIAP